MEPDIQSIQIRRAVAADIPGMVALLKSLFSIEADFSFKSSTQIRGLQLLLDAPENKACAMVAVADDGRVLGMVTMQLVVSTAEGAPSGWIEDMVISQGIRRRGLGRRLLKSIMDWGAGQGATRFQLLADKNNAPALEYYQKLGWSGTSLVCLRGRP